MEYSQSSTAAWSGLEGVAMSFGKMNTFIDIVERITIKDAEGFKTEVDNIVCEIISSIRKGNTEHDIFEKKLVLNVS